jgi:hypothetical protein
VHAAVSGGQDHHQAMRGGGVSGVETSAGTSATIVGNPLSSR